MTTQEGDDAPPPYQENPNTADNDGGKPTTTQDDNNKDDGDGGGGDGAACSPGDILDMSNQRSRTFALSFALGVYVLLAFWYPPNQVDALETSNEICEGVDNEACDDVRTLTAGFSLLILGYIAIIACIVLALLSSLICGGNKIIGILSLIAAIAATVLIMLGYFCLAGVSDAEDELAGLLVAYFAEWALVCATAMVLGIDQAVNGFFNDEKKRALAMSAGPFILFGFLAGFGYAYFGSYFKDLEDQYSSWVTIDLQDEEYSCIAAGWFMLMIVSIVRLLIEMGAINLGVNPINAAMASVVIAIFTLISGLICAAGYWALIDYMDGIDGDYSAWIISNSFFVLILCIINALDMGLIEKAKMMGGAAAASQ